jgi:phage shock protein PspC (stress-responsive transcriptional regulator)
LRRHRGDRKIAGVAGGLARYLDIDPLVVRVVLVVLAVFGGSGLLLYALGWLLIPDDGDEESEAAKLVGGRSSSTIVLVAILAIVGLAAFGQSFRGFGYGFGFGGMLVLIVVSVAAYAVWRGDRPLQRPGPTGPPPGAGGPGAYGQTPGTAYVPPYAPSAAYVPPRSEPVTAPYPGAVPPASPPKPQRPRSPLGRITVSVAMVLAGLLIAMNLSTHHDVSAAAILATCLAVVGLGLLVGAFFGRARWLIVLGVLLSLVATAATVADVPGHSVGQRTWMPRSVAAAQHTDYRLGVGHATLDLTALDLSGAAPVHLDSRLGVGQLTVLLPADASARVISQVGVGHEELPGDRADDGSDLHLGYRTPPGVTDPDLTLDLRVGFGTLEVRRATP